jgi:hypothetical protein
MADRPIHYRSLREHIEALRELGELSEVDQLDCRLSPVRASFDKVYPADLQARILRDWTSVYGLPEL